MKRFAIALILVSIAGALAAQEARIDLPGHPCPHPVRIVIEGEKHPPTPDPAAFGSTLFPLVTGSQWNQTAVNKAFGTTFHFPAPGQGKECCLMTEGTLVVTLKALQGGGINSPTSWNDDIVVFSPLTNKFWNKRAWSQTNAVNTGDTETLTIPIPASALQTGIVNLYVEDDTAVVSAHLELKGCCLR